MKNKTYEIKILDSTSGIYEILMERVMPTFHLKSEKVNIIIKPNKNLDKEIVFIDLNIIRLLNYKGKDINKVKYRDVIIDKIYKKKVTPMLYLVEASFYKGINKDTNEYIKQEYEYFLDVVKNNSEAIPDESFRLDYMIDLLIEMMVGDSNSNYELNFKFLEKLYREVFLGKENNLVNNMGNVKVTNKAFNKFKMINIEGVDRILLICSALAIFSVNSDEPCFYDVFRVKSNKSIEEQIKNTLGDIRNIRYLLYATSFLHNDAIFRFITNDNALFRVIKELDIELDTKGNEITYKFYGPDYDQIINKNYKSNKNLYSDFIAYMNTILGK